MVNGRLAHALGNLRRSAQLCRTGTMSGGQLLERFLCERDEVAFEALVGLHGPMVMGVCQRVLGNPHDAEDAFQATFLVLIRKAASIAPKELVGNWLYGVAYRTALKARSMSNRRRSREKQVTDLPERKTAAEVWNDLQPVLDCELNALPEIYRIPVVLCELGGKTKREVAQQLGLAEGTVSSRLARGRERLRHALAKRGVTISCAGLSILLSQNALQATISPAVLTATLKAGMAALAGQTAAAGVISAKVAALTQGVLQAMFLTKLKIATAVVFFIGLVAAGMGGLSQTFATEQPENTKQVQAKKKKPPLEDVEDRQLQAELELAKARLAQAEVNLEVAIAQARAAQAAYEAIKARVQKPAKATQGKIYLHKGIDLTIYDPKKKQFMEFARLDEEHQKNYQSDSARLSPDGRFLAFGQAEEGTPPSKIQIRDLTKGDPPNVIVDMPGKELSNWSWSPDGKRLSFAVWGEDGKTYTPCIVEIATQKVQKVTLPEVKGKGPDGYGALIQAWSPDGMWLVNARGRFHLVNPKTKEVRQLTTEPIGFFAGTCQFSPDGKKILLIGIPKQKQCNLSVIDVLTGKKKVLGDLTDKWGFTAAWSPDGRRIVCSSVEVDEKFKRTGPCRVEIYDADGQGTPQLLIEDAEAWLTVTAWR